MGVNGLWSILSETHHERLPLPVFCSQFHRAYGRPPRIAVDAYQWIFEGRLGGGNGGYGGNGGAARPGGGRPCVQLIFLRVKYLLSLNVMVLLVFDGPGKPAGKRKFGGESSDSESGGGSDICGSASGNSFQSDVALTKRMLQIWGVSFITAAGEAEAECARLNRAGIVDWVITNDADAIVFGGTNILRNYSFYREDVPFTTRRAAQRAHPLGGGEAGKPLEPGKEIFVTPVTVSGICDHFGLQLQRQHWVLFALLTGGDYSSGVRGFGAVRAWRAATAGLRGEAEVPFDAAAELARIYLEIEGSAGRETAGALQKWKVAFQEALRAAPETYFGGGSKNRSRRKPKGAMKAGQEGLAKYNIDIVADFPDDATVRLYFYPALRVEASAFVDKKTTNHLDEFLATPLSELLRHTVDLTGFAEFVRQARFTRIPEAQQAGAVQKYLVAQLTPAFVPRYIGGSRAEPPMGGGKLPILYVEEARDQRIAGRSPPGDRNGPKLSELCWEESEESGNDHWTVRMMKVKFRTAEMFAGSLPEGELSGSGEFGTEGGREDSAWVPRETLKVLNGALVAQFDAEVAARTEKIEKKREKQFVFVTGDNGSAKLGLVEPGKSGEAGIIGAKLGGASGSSGAAVRVDLKNNGVKLVTRRGKTSTKPRSPTKRKPRTGKNAGKTSESIMGNRKIDEFFTPNAPQETEIAFSNGKLYKTTVAQFESPTKNPPSHSKVLEATPVKNNRVSTTKGLTGLDTAELLFLLETSESSGGESGPGATVAYGGSLTGSPTRRRKVSEDGGNSGNSRMKALENLSFSDEEEEEEDDYLQFDGSSRFNLLEDVRKNLFGRSRNGVGAEAGKGNGSETEKLEEQGSGACDKERTEVFTID